MNQVNQNPGMNEVSSAMDALMSHPIKEKMLKFRNMNEQDARSFIIDYLTFIAYSAPKYANRAT